MRAALLGISVAALILWSMSFITKPLVLNIKTWRVVVYAGWFEFSASTFDRTFPDVRVASDLTPGVTPLDMAYMTNRPPDCTMLSSGNNQRASWLIFSGQIFGVFALVFGGLLLYLHRLKGSKSLVE